MTIKKEDIEVVFLPKVRGLTIKGYGFLGAVQGKSGKWSITSRGRTTEMTAEEAREAMLAIAHRLMAAANF
jgi:hypothetical protein